MCALMLAAHCNNRPGQREKPISDDSIKPTRTVLFVWLRGNATRARRQIVVEHDASLPRLSGEAPFLDFCI